MQQPSANGRQSGHVLLRSLRQDPWSQRSLATMLGQLHFLYQQVLAFEERHRDRWRREIPISELVPAFGPETLGDLERCILALDEPGPLVIRPYTADLCETWAALAGTDSLLSFAVVAIGAYWLEPAWRAALREALWRQPNLYNGDTRFCWAPGGPEGEQRRRLWLGVMAMGPAAGRAGRLAKAARQRWYDSLLVGHQRKATQPLQLELPLTAWQQRG